MHNLKLVLKTYSALRQMSPDDLALLETLRKFNDSEREAFVEALSDKPQGKVAAKAKERIVEHCDACDYTKRHSVHKDSILAGYHEFQSSKKPAKKSPRASPLGEVIKGTAGNKPHLGDGPVCTTCSYTEDYEDHARPSPHYHPFSPPASSAGGPSPAGTSGPLREDVTDAVHVGD